MVRITLGLLLGLFIGVGCRYFDIPLPGPPKFIGALVIVSITTGYLVTDSLLARHTKATGSAARPATTAQYCGGPTGFPPSRGQTAVPPKAVPQGGKGEMHPDRQVEETVS